MKLVIAKTLLEQELGSICSVLTKGSIIDPGRYVIMKATQAGLGLLVSRNDLMAVAMIPATTGILVIETPGECALDGNFLLKVLQTSALEDKLTLEFCAIGKDEDSLLENDEEAIPEADAKDGGKAPDKINKKSGTLKGAFETSEETFTIQTVEWSKNQELVIPGGTTVTTSGQDFIGLVKRVGVAAGDNKLDSDHTNIFVRGKESVLDLVTKTTTQLAWAKAPATVQAECEIVVPYHLLKEISGMLSADSIDLVVVEKSGDAPKGLFLRQKATFGTVTSIRLARICGTGIKFGSFETRLNQLDFSRKCLFSRTSLKRICDGLDPFTHVRTKISFDPASEKSRISFAKKEDHSVLKFLSLNSASGDPIEVDASSKHFKQIVSVCEEDVLRMEFSGKETLLMVGIQDQNEEKYSRFRCFFMPF